MEGTMTQLGGFRKIAHRLLCCTMQRFVHGDPIGRIEARYEGDSLHRTGNALFCRYVRH